MPHSLTLTDQQRGWRITDPILRLRDLATGRLYPLPDPGSHGTGSILGAADGPLQLHDPTGRISRQHAHLAWDGAHWMLRDLDSKNGLWIDGIRRREAELSPGLELGLGGLILLVESAALLRLHSLVTRLLGWGEAHRRDADRALSSLRRAAHLHASLILCGEGDLVPIARRLHRETLGAHRPFITCGPGDRALPLLRRAGDGTLCLSAAEPPRDLAATIDALRTTSSLARLVTCTPAAGDASPIGALLGPTAWLELPPLAARPDELPRLLAEAAADAAAELARPFAPLRTGDLAQLASLRFAGLADLHDTARRLVVLRLLGVTAGATHLGITHGALSRWARRRGLGT